MFTGEDLFVNNLYLSALTQATVYDNNISNAYGKLKLSKLTKELHFFNIDRDVLNQDEWFISNFNKDVAFVQDSSTKLFKQHSDVLLSDINANLKSMTDFLVFNPKKEDKLLLNEIKSSYNSAFYFASIGDKEKADSKLNQVDSFLNKTV